MSFYKRSAFLVLLLYILQVLFPISLMAEEKNQKTKSLSAETFPGAQSQKKIFQNDKLKVEEAYLDRSQRVSRFVFSELPRHLGNDLKTSVWGWGGLGLVLGSGLAGGMSTQDKKIQKKLDRHSLFGKTGNDILGYVGAPYSLAGVDLIVTLVGAGAGHARLQETGEILLESLFLSEGITIVAKYAFNRDRPNGEKRGFPSAHTSGMFSAATSLEVLYGPKVGIPAYLMAGAVGLSRIDSDKHYLSDVLMGAVIGTVIGYGTARYHKGRFQKISLLPEVGSDSLHLRVHYGF